MLGRFWTSISKPMLVDPSSDDASSVTLFATMFWLLGICINSTLSNFWVKCFVSLRYFCILSSFVSYSSYSSRCFPDFQSRQYSFVLDLIIGGREFQLDFVFKHFFVWDGYDNPHSPLLWADELSVCIVHHFVWLVRLSSSGKVNSTMKSTRR